MRSLKSRVIMTDLEERVAKAIIECLQERDFIYKCECGEWTSDDNRALARAALDEIGINRILELLQPFAYEEAAYCDHAAILYKELGGDE